MLAVLDELRDRPTPARRWIQAVLVGAVLLALLGPSVAAASLRTAAAPMPAASGYQIPVVVGAVPYWDEADARTSIEIHSEKLDVASPWSYAVTAEGKVVLQPDLNVVSEQQLTTRLHELNLKVIPTIANTSKGLWDQKTVSTVISDPSKRSTLVNSVIALINLGGFDGIQIDFEDLVASDRSNFSALVTELGAAVHGIGKVLYVTVHAKESDAGYDQRNAAQDYAAIGKAADLVTLMAYDWHWATGPSGPIAPYDWVERVIKYAITQIPPNRLLLGVGLFGYDWVGSQAVNLTWRQIVALAAQHPADELWDVGSQSPHLTYTANGQKHEVWYENGRSVAGKLGLVREYGLAGVEMWRLGGEDPSVWEPGP